MATYPIRQLADNGGTAQFVPVTAPEAVQFPDGSNLNTLIGSIATIESNPVAANHAVGEFLCINGQVYEVIDAITAGDSIALGENVQVANLGSQITALNNGLTNLIQYTSLSLTTDAQGNAILPSTYKLGFQAGTRQVISVHVNGNLVTCSNCGLTENGTPFVTCHNYNGTIYASSAVNLMVLYMQH